MIQRWFPQVQCLVDLVLKPCCALCERSSSEVVCIHCQRRLRACGLPVTPQQSVEGLPLVAWGQYGGGLKQAIAALKYEGKPHLSTLLGGWLAESWLASPAATAAVVVVPIPLHPDKQRQRGYNQAELLAQAFCDRTRLPLRRHGLARLRQTDAQFGLSAAARSQNLSGAFALGRDLQRRSPQAPVLLVDDIYTTGATVTAAVQALGHQGIPCYGVAVLARALMHRLTPDKTWHP